MNNTATSQYLSQTADRLANLIEHIASQLIAEGTEANEATKAAFQVVMARFG